MRAPALSGGHDRDALSATHHASSRQRRWAYLLALPIPVLIWLGSSFIIASQLFGLPLAASIAIAGCCALLVALLELLMMLSPPRWYVGVCRLVIALLVSVLGATCLDLCIFGSEITAQLEENARHELSIRRQALAAQFDARIARQDAAVREKKSDWDRARAAANDEAGGSGRSGRKGVGPVWAKLDREARLRQEVYQQAVQAGEQLAARKDEEVAALVPLDAAKNVGVLTRVEALAAFNAQHPHAQATWLALCLLVLGMEMAVVLVKVAFGMTVEDQLRQHRAQLTLGSSREYVHARNTPTGRHLDLVMGSA